MNHHAVIIGFAIAAILFYAVFAGAQPPLPPTPTNSISARVAAAKTSRAFVPTNANDAKPVAAAIVIPPQNTNMIWIGLVLDGTNEIQQCLDMTNQIWFDVFLTNNPTVWFQVPATNRYGFFRNKITWQAGNKIGCLVSTNAPF